MNTDYKSIENSLVGAASLAVDSLNENFRFTDVKTIDKPSLHNLPDYVTQADLEAEELIRKFLGHEHADIAFVGEEYGGNIDAHERFFLVDPLDGTSNFKSLRDDFSVSIAYVERGEVCAAAIAHPTIRSIIHASAGNGVHITDMDERAVFPVRGFYQGKDLKEIQLECEFPFTRDEEFGIVQKLLPAMSGLRKSGSTALDIFHQASGYKSAVLSSHLSPYDIAAGLLIVRESGGVITDLHGKPATIHSDAILSASPVIHDKLICALQL